MALRLQLAPTVRLLRSRFPVVSIWRFNMVPDSPRPAPVAEDALILRPEFDPDRGRVPAGPARWRRAIAAGAGRWFRAARRAPL